MIIINFKVTLQDDFIHWNNNNNNNNNIYLFIQRQIQTDGYKITKDFYIANKVRPYSR